MATGQPIVKFHSDEWEKGYRAGRRGLSDAHNPYILGTLPARAWWMGQMVGRTKQLTIVAGRPPEPRPSQPPELPPDPSEPAPDPLPRV